MERKEGTIMTECKCLEKRTDGLPPCGKGRGYQRPDGYYCDCGHDVECCYSYRGTNAHWQKWKEEYHAGKS